MCAEYWSFGLILGKLNLEISHLLCKVMVLKNNSKVPRNPLKYIKSVKPRKMVRF